MEYVFSIIMFAFGGCLLLYAGIIARDYNAIPRNYATNPRNKKEYAKKFAKILALIALPMLAAGLIGLWSPLAGGIVLVAAETYVILNAGKFTRIEDELKSEDEIHREEDDII